MKSLLLLSLSALLWTSPLLAADTAPVSIENFAKLPDVRALALSPTGEYLAASVPRGNRTGIIVLRIDKMDVVSARDFGPDTHVLGLQWVSDTRLMGEIGENFGSLEQPSSAGELFAIDADGTTFTYLIGFRTRRRDPFRGAAGLLDSLIQDKDSAVIVTRPFDVSDQTYRPGYDKRASAETINVVSGRRDKIVDAPEKGPGSFVTDSDGFVRFFSGLGDSSLSAQTYQRLPAEPGRWSPVSLAGVDNIEPISATSGAAFVRGQGEHSTTCLYETDAAVSNASVLACREDVDLGFVAMSSDGSRPIRAYFQPGRFVSVNVAPDSSEGRLLEALQKRFEPNVLLPQGWSKDGNRLLFTVAGDKVPGEVFLFDRKEKRARFLLSSRRWIDHTKMAERKPIEYAARDGLTIRGYLTLPPSSTKKKRLPLVVLPHGGPIGVRDSWLWEPDAQLLASRGYAVLQVNFRGSGGYGGEFIEAGRKQWGQAMIDDIVDGTRWAIEQGYADAKRMCIYGASYGGYASLMSAVRQPDLFRCVVGYVGVYDLETMAKNTDITQSSYGREFFDDYIGKSAEELRSQSPMMRLAELKAPMLIVHGEEDKRAPFSEAEALRAALDQKNHPYEWMTREKEGHGFYALDNRVAFYETLLAFLGKHIGN